MVATNSLDGGTDFAFGGATTKDGSQDRTIIDNPFPFAGGNVSITIDNLGKQVSDYLASHTPIPVPCTLSGAAATIYSMIKA